MLAKAISIGRLGAELSFSQWLIVLKFTPSKFAKSPCLKFLARRISRSRDENVGIFLSTKQTLTFSEYENNIKAYSQKKRVEATNETKINKS